MDETDNNGYELHSNTFVNGQLMFTYDENSSEWGVALNDWLGTKRVQVDPAIVGNLTGFQSLPFGDDLASSGYGLDSTEHHFTGKERDSESGLDYFGARYYASSIGRFLSPDPGWTAAIDPSNPQSLNLYSYVLDSPSTFVDPNGMILCNYGTTNDSADYEDAESADVCTNLGGTIVEDQESVKVTASIAQGQSVSSTSSTDTIPNKPPAPNNGTPWYKNPCVQSALAKGAASTAFDAIGTLPEGGTVAAAFSLWHGAAGVSNGTKLLGRAAFGGALISTASAAHDLQGPQESTASNVVAGLQVTAGGAGVTKGLIEDIPVAGQAIAFVSVGLDLVGTGVEVAECDGW